MPGAEAAAAEGVVDVAVVEVGEEAEADVGEEVVALSLKGEVEVVGGRSEEEVVVARDPIFPGRLAALLISDRPEVPGQGAISHREGWEAVVVAGSDRRICPIAGHPEAAERCPVSEEEGNVQGHGQISLVRPRDQEEAVVDFDPVEEAVATFSIFSRVALAEEAEARSFQIGRIFLVEVVVRGNYQLDRDRVEVENSGGQGGRDVHRGLGKVAVANNGAPVAEAIGRGARIGQGDPDKVELGNSGVLEAEATGRTGRIIDQCVPIICLRVPIAPIDGRTFTTTTSTSGTNGNRTTTPR